MPIWQNDPVTLVDRRRGHSATRHSDSPIWRATRDQGQGLLESAVLRPRNRQHYDRVDDLIELASIYAEAISANHPFFDGNKRTAFFAMAVFLELNDLPPKAPEPEATSAMLPLAADTAFAPRFREWVRRWSL